MRKTLTLCFILTACASTAFAQDVKCTLSIEKSPTVRGLFLGMRRHEVEALFYKFPYTQPDHTGFVREVAYRNGFKNPEYNSGVSSLEISFLDNSVVAIIITYDVSATWSNNEQFARQVAAALNLPYKWKKSRAYDRDIPLSAHVMPCAGFSIVATVHRSPGGKLLILNDSVERIRLDRMLRQADRERKDFKP